MPAIARRRRRRRGSRATGRRAGARSAGVIIDPRNGLFIRQVLGPLDQRKPPPCEPKSGLSTSGAPGRLSCSTIPAAASRFETTQVSGVGRPARAISREVAALSTERSMAVGAFQTVTPRRDQGRAARRAAWWSPRTCRPRWSAGARRRAVSRQNPDPQGLAAPGGHDHVGQREQHRLDALRPQGRQEPALCQLPLSAARAMRMGMKTLDGASPLGKCYGHLLFCGVVAGAARETLPLRSG